MHNSKGFHPQNTHNQNYDFPELIKACPELGRYASPNPHGELSIDYSHPKAVYFLNKALLKLHYQIEGWNLPEGALCPAVPGRADYLYHIADLLDRPLGPKTKGLDIGVGASCIYPLLGNSLFGWSFIGTDIDPKSIESARAILSANPKHKKHITCRLQNSANDIFVGLFQSDQKVSFTMCNPPFHSSLEEALEGSEKKWKNLNSNKLKKGHEPVKPKATLNFGGQKAELWCPGGELEFVKTMIKQSVAIKENCPLFTSLISKKENLPALEEALKKIKATEIHKIEMKHGNKISHILGWSFRAS